MISIHSARSASTLLARAGLGRPAGRPSRPGRAGRSSRPAGPFGWTPIGLSILLSEHHNFDICSPADRVEQRAPLDSARALARSPPARAAGRPPTSGRAGPLERPCSLMNFGRAGPGSGPARGAAKVGPGPGGGKFGEGFVCCARFDSSIRWKSMSKLAATQEEEEEGNVSRRWWLLLNNTRRARARPGRASCPLDWVGRRVGALGPEIITIICNFSLCRRVLVQFIWPPSGRPARVGRQLSGVESKLGIDSSTMSARTRAKASRRAGPLRHH